MTQQTEGMLSLFIRIVKPSGLKLLTNGPGYAIKEIVANEKKGFNF
jgi:hypothetical protein